MKYIENKENENNLMLSKNKLNGIYGIYGMTAHARFQQIKSVKLIGYENYLYCDTDSIYKLED